MKKNLLFGFAFLFFISSLFAQSPSWQWAKSAGGSNADAGQSITTDASGNVYVTGYFQSSSITIGSTTLINTGSGTVDMYVVKYDASGNVLWAKSAGGANDDYGATISADTSGNVYIGGGFQSPSITFGSTTLTKSGGVDTADVYIVKYNSAGVVQWAKSAGGNKDDDCNGIFTDANGNIFATGFFGSPTITFGSTTLTKTGNGTNVFLVKYDATGNVGWAKNAGGSTGIDDFGQSVASDKNGNSFITGFFESPTITFGSNTLNNSGTRDVFIAKYDPSGTVLWAKSAGGTFKDEGMGIAVDTSGNCYVTGHFKSNSISFGSYTLNSSSAGNHPNIFIVKYDGNGIVHWAKSAGGNNDDMGFGINTQPNGNSYITGMFGSSTLAFGNTTLTSAGGTYLDAFVAKYDAQGNPLWAKSVGGVADDYANGISSDAFGNAYVTGVFGSSTIDFDNSSLQNANTDSTSDIFVAKLNPICSLNATVSTTNSTCGQATGTATVVATGGNAPYTYVWTNGDKTSLADSLAHGLYMVYVSDASGCTAQAPAIINDAGAPTISVTLAQNLTCNGSEDGAVSVSVSGGTQPYTYLWADGNTTQSQTGLDAGPHQIQVVDANSCMVSKIIMLTEPNPITLQDTIQNASCGSSDGAAGVLPSGGTSPYTYSWSTGVTTQIITNVAAGAYSVMVTDKNGCTKDGMGTIKNVGAAVAVIDSIHPAKCSTGVGDIFISVSGGTPPYTFAWTTGATTKNLIGVPAGNYGVTIYSNGNPCTGSLAGTLPPYIAPAPAICIVTVDTATGKNVCAFVKDTIANKHFKQYNFFRETTTAGVYQWMGSRPANQVSIWTDPSANPLSRAWRYKITAEDSCGNESPVSGHHKTIHCAANIGVGNVVNLAWDDYEGFSYGTFIIYRYTPATGWDSLDAVPSNLHAYTDLNPPSPLTNVFYFIAVGNPNNCVPNIANPSGNAEKINPQVMAVNLNSSKSNVYKLNQTATGENENVLANSISVYPNPSTGTFTIASEIKSQVEIYSLIGKKVLEKNLFQKSETINLSEPNGIYLLKFKTEKGTVTKKIIIQK